MQASKHRPPQLQISKRKKGKQEQSFHSLPALKSRQLYPRAKQSNNPASTIHPVHTLFLPKDLNPRLQRRKCLLHTSTRRTIGCPNNHLGLQVPVRWQTPFRADLLGEAVFLVVLDITAEALGAEGGPCWKRWLVSSFKY